ncbi:hypothetical protein PR048_021715 [Dryococelus australis]|uniref:Uncharacterized protein n=1 Tax=Dryococelus australis TaxID=614101 RepID=A0ABQ9GYY9_9NEOP|nr:hypothetical protein PR048_021715 [Dryococelus australis]
MDGGADVSHLEMAEVPDPAGEAQGDIQPLLLPQPKKMSLAGRGARPHRQAQGNVQPLPLPAAAVEVDELSWKAEPEEPSLTSEVQMGTEPIPPLDQDEAATPGNSVEPQR